MHKGKKGFVNWAAAAPVKKITAQQQQSGPVYVYASPNESPVMKKCTIVKRCNIIRFSYEWTVLFANGVK